jgi:pimeloyl-ACP methyl ester carboxylesterase
MWAETPRVIPETQYARTPDGIYIAYQVAGEGPVDLVWQFDILGNVDLAWEEPLLRVLLPRAALGARLILHDRRGTGLSSRNVSPPDLETRVADLRVVLDEVGSQRPVLFGVAEGGAPNVLFAASDPERVHSIVWWAPSARSAWTPDYPWGVRPEYVDIDAREVQHWGTLEGARAWAKGEAMFGSIPTEEEIYWHAKLARHTGTPDVGRELTRIWYETDIRAVLPSVKLRTLLLAQETNTSGVEEAEYIASLMPLAEFKPIPGGLETSPEVQSAVRDEYQHFIGVELPKHDLDTVLATILFTDIVASTENQAALGDHGWKDLIQRHHVIVREHFGGGAASRTTRPAMASTLRSTARLARSGVRSTSLSGSGSWGSRSGRGCIPVNARSWMASALASRFRSEHELPRLPAPRRCASHRRSGTSSPAPVSRSRTPASTS